MDISASGKKGGLKVLNFKGILLQFIKSPCSIIRWRIAAGKDQSYRKERNIYKFQWKVHGSDDKRIICKNAVERKPYR